MYLPKYICKFDIHRHLGSVHSCCSIADFCLVTVDLLLLVFAHFVEANNQSRLQIEWNIENSMSTSSPEPRNP